MQFVTDRVWISDFVLGTPVRYHVGMDGLGLFMVLLTAVGIAASVGAGIRAGRDRPRAYYGLVLLLEAALVLLFTAQDLVLFYVGWEVMMIPLFILMAVWGGEGRRAATIRFVDLHHGRVAADAGRDRRHRHPLPHLRGVRRSHSGADLDLLLLRRRVLHQGAAVPAARLAARGLPGVDAGGHRPALGRDLQGRRLRPAAVLPADVPGVRPRLALAVPRPGAGGPAVRRRCWRSASPMPAAWWPTPHWAR